MKLTKSEVGASETEDGWHKELVQSGRHRPTEPFTNELVMLEERLLMRTVFGMANRNTAELIIRSITWGSVLLDEDRVAAARYARRRHSALVPFADVLS